MRGLREEGNYSRGQTWIRACKWIDGLICLYNGKEKTFEECKKEYYKCGSREYQKKYLQYISLVNVNKNGSDTIPSKDTAVAKIAYKYKDFIKRQIDLYNPDIVIIGNKGYLTNLYKDMYNCHDKIVETKNDTDFYLHDNRIVISTQHPAVSKNETYNDILSVIKKLK